MLDKKEKCNLSRPEVGIQVLSRESQILHTGALTHVCALEKGHDKREKDPEEYCRCTCNFRWRKFHGE